MFVIFTLGAMQICIVGNKDIRKKNNRLSPNPRNLYKFNFIDANLLQHWSRRRYIFVYNFGLPWPLLQQTMFVWPIMGVSLFKIIGKIWNWGKHMEIFTNASNIHPQISLFLLSSWPFWYRVLRNLNTTIYDKTLLQRQKYWQKTNCK